MFIFNMRLHLSENLINCKTTTSNSLAYTEQGRLYSGYQFAVYDMNNYY